MRAKVYADSARKIYTKEVHTHFTKGNVWYVILRTSGTISFEFKIYIYCNMFHRMRNEDKSVWMKLCMKERESKKKHKFIAAAFHVTKENIPVILVAACELPLYKYIL